MTSSSKLVFFGTEDFSLPSLRALVDNGYQVVAVVTKPDARRGRKSELVMPAVKAYALEHDIPVLQPSKITEISDTLSALHADAAVLVSYGKIISERIINLFMPVGIINIHPSLLPKYRGPAPIEAAIANGDDETGISIMQLTRGMDEGPVFVQERVVLKGTETKPELYEAFAQHGAELLITHLPAILTGVLKPKPQKNTDVSYTSLLTKQDGRLDPVTDDAYACERKVRAYLGYPKTSLKIQNNDVLVTSAKVVATKSPDELVIECANNTLLRIDKLVAPSGKTMSGAAYLRGYAA
jgi:methionyl-tRNA formyltransferase